MATDTTYTHTLYEEAATIRFAEYLLSEERAFLIVENPAFDPDSIPDRYRMVTHADVSNWLLKEGIDGKQ